MRLLYLIPSTAHKFHTCDVKHLFVFVFPFLWFDKNDLSHSLYKIVQICVSEHFFWGGGYKEFMRSVSVSVSGVTSGFSKSRIWHHFSTVADCIGKPVSLLQCRIWSQSGQKKIMSNTALVLYLCKATCCPEVTFSVIWIYATCIDTFWSEALSLCKDTGSAVGNVCTEDRRTFYKILLINVNNHSLQLSTIFRTFITNKDP